MGAQAASEQTWLVVLSCPVLVSAMFGRLLAAQRLVPRVAARRNFASTPQPLSIRADSLLVKCIISALVYFVPQDAVFLTGLFWYWHTQASTIAPRKSLLDAEAALDEFKTKKGLSDVKVSKSSRTWYVTQ